MDVGWRLKTVPEVGCGVKVADFKAKLGLWVEMEPDLGPIREDLPVISVSD